MKFLLNILTLLLVATAIKSDKEPLECTLDYNRMGGFKFCTFSTQSSDKNDVNEVKINSAMFQGQAINANSVTAILISSSEFDHIPSSIYANFGDISILKLVGSKINQIDSNDFAAAPHLKVLEVHSSQIGKISSKAFELLKNLEEIKIEQSDIDSFSSDAFSGLPKLKKIILTENTYTNGVPKFKNLPSTVKVEY